MKKFQLLILLLNLFYTGHLAAAHAMLEQASPTAGSIIKTSPREVHLKFSEPLEPRFSKVEVRSATGAVIAVGSAGHGRSNELAVHVPALHPGKYNVIWKVLSIDSHTTQGNFSFEVKP
jgi:copper resistance protein C